MMFRFVQRIAKPCANTIGFQQKRTLSLEVLRSRAHVLILGPPGGGKGTISKKIVKDFSFKHISAGDLIREQIRKNTPMGITAHGYITEGLLVPDPIVIELVAESLDHLGGRWLLDGYPRSLVQAEALDHTHKIDLVLDILVPHEEIIERLSGRLIHEPSGRTYHTIYSPPKVPGIDDVTGEPLTQREGLSFCVLSVSSLVLSLPGWLLYR
eukprot:Colp12_sorted_trinity150504_noHs@7510